MGKINSKFWKAYFWVYDKLKKLPGLRSLPIGATGIFFNIVIAKIKTFREKKMPKPEKTVLDYDWDYLIIIDACRHDLYEEVNGKSSHIISQGSCTLEWFNNTFEEGHYDLIYVSSNPLIAKPQWELGFSKLSNLVPMNNIQKEKVSFSHLEPVWNHSWDRELKSVPPKETTKKSLELVEKNPTKRMIIHYLQPHCPFIGEKRVGIGKGFEGGFNFITGENGDKKDEDVWDWFRTGKIDKEELWKAYKSNLELVMKEVKKLTKELEGKVVLTSDHGNLVGEYGVTEHPLGVRVPNLVKVPWVVLKERKGKKEKEELRGISI